MMNLLHSLKRRFLATIARVHCIMMGHVWGGWLPTTEHFVFRQCYFCCKLDQRTVSANTEGEGLG